MKIFSALIREYLVAYPDGEYRPDEPMRDHTTLKIGGPVGVMFFPRTVEEVQYIVKLSRSMGVRSLVIGRGSNLLCSDEPMDIAVINTANLAFLELDGLTVTAGAGVPLSRCALAAANASLTGLEFAHGIPGTVGGAVVMNAGAYGGEMKDVVLSVTALNKELELVTLTAEECNFSYRHSVFSGGEYIVLSARMGLIPGDTDDILTQIRELAAKRREKQPLDMPSAGSTFKRPAQGYAAAMIEEAGLKGVTIGGAQVSEKHSGFLVNRGGATFADFTALMDHVMKTVYDSTGVMLSPEVKIVS